MNDHAIGVFDSGLGGLTVLQALADLLPHEDLIYLGDTARYPYGPKPDEELKRYSTQIAEFLVEQGVKMIVIACNSATAAARDLLRDRFEVPIIGVVEPGVRAAVKASRTGRVGVIGTQMTADSRIYERTSDRLRTGLDVTTLACPGFVELIEAGDTESERAHDVVRAGLGPLQEHDIDALVLGCTHYPLLARTIKDVAGRHVVLVSSADETAFEVRSILERTGWAAHDRTRTGRRTYFTTGDPATFRRLGQRFLGYELVDVRAHRWEVAGEPATG
ncbi:MAG TPA: glutamate racemase [Nitriliruptorales bacterium]